nr:YcxB family protein [uncultured Desulfobacter sp.]
MPDNTTGWLKYIIVSLGGGLGGMVGDSIFSIIRVLISANIKSGILGEHYYELLEDGILEKTQVNEGISKWEGVLEIVERGDYLIIKVSSYHFHVIPKRSFPDESEYKSFKHMACSLWQKAQKCVEDNKSIDI